eukprot:5064947-Pleurochrysis_carterae.AAC.1
MHVVRSARGLEHKPTRASCVLMHGADMPKWGSESTNGPRCGRDDFTKEPAHGAPHARVTK